MAFQIATLPGGSAEMIGLRVHQVLASSTQGFSTLNDVAAFASTPSTEWAAVALTMLLVRGPGLLVFSRMLSFGFTAPKSRGFIGFLLGVAVAVLCVTLGLSLAEGIALAIRHHMQVVSFIGDERPSIVLVYSALLVLPYGLLGGFAGGALLHALTPLATAQRVGSVLAELPDSRARDACLRLLDGWFSAAVSRCRCPPWLARAGSIRVEPTG